MILIAILSILIIYVAVASFYLLRRLSKLSDLLDECDNTALSDSRLDMVKQSQTEY